MTLDARSRRYLPMWALLLGAACNPTEPPFRNAYWDNYGEGLYVDAVNGEPLFSSRDKYDAGTGWPSFTQPIEPERVVTRSDWSFGALRTEVRSRGSDAHLGHVFGDGPAPTGLRYCINSFALRFIPSEDLEGHGYREYHTLFVSAPPHTGVGVIQVSLSDTSARETSLRKTSPHEVSLRETSLNETSAAGASMGDTLLGDASSGVDAGPALSASAEQR